MSRQFITEDYIVRVRRHKDVSIENMKSYIQDGIEHMRGCYHPEDPLFYKTTKKILVRVTKRKKV